MLGWGHGGCDLGVLGVLFLGLRGSVLGHGPCIPDAETGCTIHRYHVTPWTFTRQRGQGKRLYVLPWSNPPSHCVNPVMVCGRREGQRGAYTVVSIWCVAAWHA